MNTAAVLIIYFGAGHYAQFDTERYASVAECSAVRAALISHFADKWTGPRAGEIVCVPVAEDEQ